MISRKQIAFVCVVFVVLWISSTLGLASYLSNNNQESEAVEELKNIETLAVGCPLDSIKYSVPEGFPSSCTGLWSIVDRQTKEKWWVVEMHYGDDIEYVAIERNYDGDIPVTSKE